MNVIAPGQGIESAWHTGDGDYATINGTSMAAPAVAGAMAIWVGFENIQDNAARVRFRLYRNALRNVRFGGFGFSTQFPWLVNTGVRQPPYIGAPRRGPQFV